MEAKNIHSKKTSRNGWHNNTHLSVNLKTQLRSDRKMKVGKGCPSRHLHPVEGGQRRAAGHQDCHHLLRQGRQHCEACHQRRHQRCGRPRAGERRF